MLSCELAIKLAKKSKKNIVITDEYGRIIFCNDAWTGLCGYTLSDVYGDTCGILQSITSDEDTINNMNMKIKAKKTCFVMIDNIKKDGTSFKNMLTIFPLKDGFFAESIDMGPTDYMKKYKEVVDKRRLSLSF